MAVCCRLALCLDVFVINVLYSVLCAHWPDMFVTFMLHFHTWCIAGCILMFHEVVSLPACGPGTSFSPLPAFVVAFLLLLVLVFCLWRRWPLVGSCSPVLGTGAYISAGWYPGCLLCDCAIMLLEFMLCCLLSAFLDHTTLMGLVHCCHCSYQAVFSLKGVRRVLRPPRICELMSGSAQSLHLIIS